MAESGAIVQGLLARYGGGAGVGPEAPDFARYLYWLHYAEGSLRLQLLREWTVARMLPDADAHPGLARLREGTRQHLGLVDEALAASPCLAGRDFTAADITMACPFTTFRRRVRPIDLAPYPAIEARLGRPEGRPAVHGAPFPPSRGNAADRRLGAARGREPAGKDLQPGTASSIFHPSTEDDDLAYPASRRPR